MTLPRTMRYGHRFGAAIDACGAFDREKYLPAMLGFTLAGNNVSEMGLVFGAGNVACADAYVRAALEANTHGCQNASDSMQCVIQNFLLDHGIEESRVRNAAAKMTAKGWWASENWYFYWCYFSGYKPFYLNPLALAASAAVGLGGWFAYKKWVK